MFKEPHTNVEEEWFHFSRKVKMGRELFVSDAEQKWYMCKFKKDIL